MDLRTLYVIQWNANERVMMACPYSTMLEENLAAYDSGRCSGFYPIAFARNRDHAEEVFGQIMNERDRRFEKIDVTPLDIEDRWLQ